jgi:hypothetical protein
VNCIGTRRISGAGPVPKTFSHRLLRQAPSRMAGGTVRIVDSTIFPASRTIAAALIELEHGALRELHWHPNADEWQYYIEGEGRMTVFGSEGIPPVPHGLIDATYGPDFRERLIEKDLHGQSKKRNKCRHRHRREPKHNHHLILPVQTAQHNRVCLVPTRSGSIIVKEW